MIKAVLFDFAGTLFGRPAHRGHAVGAAEEDLAGAAVAILDDRLELVHRQARRVDQLRVLAHVLHDLAIAAHALGEVLAGAGRVAPPQVQHDHVEAGPLVGGELPARPVIVEFSPVPSNGANELVRRKLLEWIPPVLAGEKIAALAITGYGMATFEGPMLSVKSVNALAHYTDWIIAHVHTGALGWNGFMAAGMIYWLLPRLWNKPLHSVSLANVHFWIGTVGILLYVVAMWVSGVTQGLMWKAQSPGGGLMYVGTKGKLVQDTYGLSPKLYPAPHAASKTPPPLSPSRGPRPRLRSQALSPARVDSGSRRHQPPGWHRAAARRSEGVGRRVEVVLDASDSIDFESEVAFEAVDAPLLIDEPAAAEPAIANSLERPVDPLPINRPRRRDDAELDEHQRDRPVGAGDQGNGPRELA